MQKVRRALWPRRSLGLLALALVGQQAVAQSSFTYGSTPWPEIPAPPKAKVEWVSDDMRVNGIPMRVQRFDPGRGLRANYFTLELMNENGADFDLDVIELAATPLTRRI